MKKRGLLYCNIDYIKAFIGFKKDNRLYKVGVKDFGSDEDKEQTEEEYEESERLRQLSANSNQIFLDFFGERIEVTKMPITDNFSHYFFVSCSGINVGFIGLGARKNKKDFIEITGQGLTMFGVDIFYFIMENFNLIFLKYKRIDICFDMEIDINYFHDRVLIEKFKTEKENFTPIKTKRNGFETLYFGKRNIKENSYMLNRIYNKIIDSKVKGKQFLYDDIHKNEDGTYKTVTRFETELREDLCKFYSYDILKDEEWVFFRLVKSFYKYNTQFFKFLKDDDFFKALKKNRIANKKNLFDIINGNSSKALSLYQNKILHIKEEKDKFISYGNGFIDEKDQENCKKIFLSSAKRLYRNGITIDYIHEIIDTIIIEK